jgi:hypothetical protein
MVADESEKGRSMHVCAVSYNREGRQERTHKEREFACTPARDIYIYKTPLRNALQETGTITPKNNARTPLRDIHASTT